MNPTLLKRMLLPVLVSGFLATVFSQAVYTSFAKVRIGVLQRAEPEADGTIRTAIPKIEALQHGEWILLVKSKNGTNQPLDLQVVLNSFEIGRFSLPPNRSKDALLDLPKEMRRRSFYRFMLRSNATGWNLERLEIRNLYGSAKGLVNYVILHRQNTEYGSPSIFATLLLFAVFVLIFFESSNGTPFHIKRRAGWIGPVLMFLLFTGILLIPVVSRYRPLIAVKTFFLVVILCCFQTIRAGAVSFSAKTSLLPSRPRRILQQLIILALVFLFFFVSMQRKLQANDGNYSAFLALSDHWTPRNPILRGQKEIHESLVIEPGYGYDAQFFYFMSFDPFLNAFKDRPRLYRRVVDNPPYRYGRIGFSLLTKLFSLDKPELYPKTMMFLILASHVAGVFFLIRIALFYQKSPFWALLWILIPGFSVSLTTGLPESIAAAFLLGGVHYYLQKKYGAAVLFFAASVLVRETAILFILVIACFEFFNKQRRTAFLLACSVLPYACWRAYVGWRLFDTFGMEGYFFTSTDVRVPFNGIIELYRAIYRGEYLDYVTSTAILYPLLLTFLLVLGILLFRKRKDSFSFVLAAYSLLFVSLDYHKVLLSISNAERVTYDAILFSVLVFLSLKDQHARFKRAFHVFLVLLVVYNWFFLSMSNFFRDLVQN